MSKRRGHGEGAIFERKDGRWEARVDLGWEGGRRRYKSAYGKTRAEVVPKLTKLLAEKQAGRSVPSDRLTLGRFLTDWLEETIRPNVRPKTFYSFEGIVRVHLVPGLGRHGLNKLEAQDVRRFINAKSASGLSPRTVQYILAILRRALRAAEAEKLVTHNVAAVVDSPHVTAPEMDPYDTGEVLELLEAVKGDRLEAVYTTAVALGLRRGEALGLRWDDVDLEKGSLTVRQQLQRVGGALMFSDPKTARSVRKLPLPQLLADALKEHRARQNEEKLRAGSKWANTASLVFTTKKGTPIEPRNLVRHFRMVTERAGLRPQPFHGLRHASGSILIAQGVNPRVVQQILGHSTPAMTSRYTHVVEKSVEEAAERMNEALVG